jgi:hypothetical protein
MAQIPKKNCEARTSGKGCPKGATAKSQKDRRLGIDQLGRHLLLGAASLEMAVANKQRCLGGGSKFAGRRYSAAEYCRRSDGRSVQR